MRNKCCNIVESLKQHAVAARKLIIWYQRASYKWQFTVDTFSRLSESKNHSLYGTSLKKQWLHKKISKFLFLHKVARRVVAMHRPRMGAYTRAVSGNGPVNTFPHNRHERSNRIAVFYVVRAEMLKARDKVSLIQFCTGSCEDRT
jgi:hypothetical protein